MHVLAGYLINLNFTIGILYGTVFGVYIVWLFCFPYIHRVMQLLQFSHFCSGCLTRFYENHAGGRFRVASSMQLRLVERIKIVQWK